MGDQLIRLVTVSRGPLNLTHFQSISLWSALPVNILVYIWYIPVNVSEITVSLIFRDLPCLFLSSAGLARDREGEKECPLRALSQGTGTAHPQHWAAGSAPCAGSRSFTNTHRTHLYSPHSFSRLKGNYLVFIFLFFYIFPQQITPPINQRNTKQKTSQNQKLNTPCPQHHETPMPLQISTTSGKVFKKILLILFSSPLPLYFISLWKNLGLYSIYILVGSFLAAPTWFVRSLSTAGLPAWGEGFPSAVQACPARISLWDSPPAPDQSCCSVPHPH